MEASGFTAAVPLDTEDLTSILSAEPRLDQANLPPTAVDQRIYTPLQDARRQIRLLKWRADSHITGVHDLQTSVWDLDTAPPYIAISYTWGPTVNRPIVIDGISTSVRHNAYYALWQTRQLEPHCYVWIDSICINQQDDGEKSAQVASIFHIFKRALRVVACLGEHADDSDFLYAIAKALQPHFLGLWKQHETKNRSLPVLMVSSRYERTSILVNLEAPTFQRLLSACALFLCRSYWGRLWIVQELAAAHHDVLLMCGTHTLCSRLFAMLYGTLYRDAMKIKAWCSGYSLPNIQIGVMLQDLTTVLNRACSQSDATLASLGTQMSALGHMLCADVRDRLFGTLAMTDWQRTGCTPIVPDYTKSARELAIMLARMLNLCELRNCLLALEIDYYHEEIRAALQNQRNARMPEFEDVGEPCVPLKHEEFTMFANCARLYYTGNESLTADLRQHGRRRYDIEKTSDSCIQCAARNARGTVLCDHGQKKSTWTEYWQLCSVPRPCQATSSSIAGSFSRL